MKGLKIGKIKLRTFVTEVITRKCNESVNIMKSSNVINSKCNL